METLLWLQDTHTAHEQRMVNIRPPSNHHWLWSWDRGSHGEVVHKLTATVL